MIYDLILFNPENKDYVSSLTGFKYLVLDNNLKIGKVFFIMQNEINKIEDPYCAGIIYRVFLYRKKDFIKIKDINKPLIIDINAIRGNLDYIKNIRLFILNALKYKVNVKFATFATNIDELLSKKQIEVLAEYLGVKHGKDVFIDGEIK